MNYQRLKSLVKWASLATPVFWVPALVLYPTNQATLDLFLEVCGYVAFALGISSGVLSGGIAIRDRLSTGEWDKPFLRIAMVGLGSLALFIIIIGVLFANAIGNFDRVP